MTNPIRVIRRRSTGRKSTRKPVRSTTTGGVPSRATPAAHAPAGVCRSVECTRAVIRGHRQGQPSGELVECQGCLPVGVVAAPLGGVGERGARQLVDPLLCESTNYLVLAHFPERRDKPAWRRRWKSS